MTDVRIYQPAPNAMQTGPGGRRKWVLEHLPGAAKEIDPLMGWVGSADTGGQVRLKFDSRDEAVAFAEKTGLTYHVTEPNARRVQRKNYAAQFSVQ